jgi:predicted RNA-binding protein
MIDPEALDRRPDAELRRIVEQTADADLRTRVRAELVRRHEHQRAEVREIVPETRQETTGAAPTAPAMSAAEIREARRYAVVLYDGRRLS